MTAAEHFFALRICTFGHECCTLPMSVSKRLLGKDYDFGGTVMFRRVFRLGPVALIVAAVALPAGAIVLAMAGDDDLEFHSKLLVDSADVTDSESDTSTSVAKPFSIAADRTAPELADPVRLQASGEPIDIGKLSSIAHAGPTVADVDGDGDRDLLVGDFPGYFWYFENKGDDTQPQYIAGGKLQAGNEDAKTPVY